METEDETVASRLSSMELDENKSWPKIQEEEKQPLSSTSNTFWLSSTKVRLQWIYTSPAESIDINKVRRELDQIIINRQQNARRDWWQKAWGLTDPSPKLDLIWRDEKQMKFKDFLVDDEIDYYEVKAYDDVQSDHNESSDSHDS